MYGVEMNCCALESSCPDLKGPSTMIWDKIEELVPEEKRTEEYVDRRYYTFWSVVHGLISINMTRQLTSEDMNRQVLKDAISGMITAIKS